MLTLVLTLLIISITQFTIYLILEFTNRRNNKQKHNEYDKLYDNNRTNIHFDSDICESGNKEINERETAQ